MNLFYRMFNVYSNESTIVTKLLRWKLLNIIQIYFIDMYSY